MKDTVRDNYRIIMLPLSLLRTATGSPVLVELKGGDTYNGRLTSCDVFMNMNLSEVICTSSSGERFWKLPACYIRGSAIKYLRLPPALLEQAAAEEQEQASRAPRGGGGRGGRSLGGRGRGGGPGGRGRGGGRFSGGRGDGGRGGGGGGGRGGSGRGGRGGRRPPEGRAIVNP